MKLGDRMKGYEKAFDTELPSRMPVMVRLDGNSFSKLTKMWKFRKPFDHRFRDCMISTTHAVLEYCSGSMIGYSQSDEISILLRNDQRLETEPFLKNRIQKLCSLISSIATNAFNDKLRSTQYVRSDFRASELTKVAEFDCRVFLIPENEINNYFLWRQRDSFRNCVGSYCCYKIEGGRKLVMNKSTNERQDILFKKANININDVPIWQRRGFCLIKREFEKKLVDIIGEDKVKELGKDPNEIIKRSNWITDLEIPMFSKENQYIENEISVVKKK